jgi:hypothetical protein
MIKSYAVFYDLCLFNAAQIISGILVLLDLVFKPILIYSTKAYRWYSYLPEEKCRYFKKQSYCKAQFVILILTEQTKDTKKQVPFTMYMAHITLQYEGQVGIQYNCLVPVV